MSLEDLTKDLEDLKAAHMRGQMTAKFYASDGSFRHMAGLITEKEREIEKYKETTECQEERDQQKQNGE